MKVFPPFRLDAVNQCLWRCQEAEDDERIRLTPKAFAVLNYLVERAGQLVTQEELLNALWPDTFVQPEVLRSHVLDIRGALGDSARSPRFIETRPKRGYQFIAQVRAVTIAVQDSRPKIDAQIDPAHRRLVGRSVELIELRNSLRNCMQDQRQIIFVAGEAGIGKTALADEFLRIARSDVPSLKIGRGQCVEGYGGTEPYYPILEALGQLCSGPRGDAIVQTLFAQAPTWLVQFPALVKSEQREQLHREILGATRERMLREIGEALDAITLEQPVLLVFEDLHWADPSSVDLISALARRRTPRKLLLLGTYRPVDLSLTRHPLKQVKQELLVHQLCREIPLEPLEEADVSEFLANESGGLAVPEGLAELIHRHTEGNPLFMVAVLEHMCARKLIVQETGRWKLARPLGEIDQLAPDTLRQMIEMQIERLTDDQKRVLETASLLGKFLLSVTVGSKSADMDPEYFEEVCEGLARRHQVIRSAGYREYRTGVSPCYEFVHAMFKQVVYARVAPTRRRGLHRRIAETSEALHLQSQEEAAIELAYQFEEGGAWLSAIRYLRIMAGTAGRRFEPRQAVGILEHALELARKLPEAERDQAEAELLEKLGDIYVSCYDPRSIPTYEALIELAARIGLIDVEVRALFAMAAPLARKDKESYLSCLDRVFKRSHAQEPAARENTLRLLQLYRVVAGRSSSDDPECLKFYEELRLTGDRQTPPFDYSNWMYFHNLGSRYREALRCVTEGIAALTRDTEQNPALSARYMLCQDLLPRLLLSLGEWGAALQQVEIGTSTLLKNSQPALAKIMGIPRAWVCIHASDFRGAAEICDAALSASMTGSFTLALRIMRMLAGFAAAGLGDYDKAREYFVATREEMNQHPLIGDWVWGMPLQWGFTELSLAMGDLPQARAEAEQFRSCTLSTCERTWQAMAYNSSARVAIAEGYLDEARDLVGKASEVMQGFEVPLAEWRVHATAWELEARLHELVTAEHHRQLAEACVMKLANSLSDGEPIRRAFLSSQIVRVVLDGKGSTLPIPSDASLGEAPYSMPFVR